MKKYCFIALLALSACVEDIEYKGSGTASQLVVNAQAYEGDSLWAEVGHSRFFLDDSNGSTSLADASVEFSIDGESFAAVYNAGADRYVCRHTAKAGDVVTVRVSHADYGSASASETIPQASTLDLLSQEFVYMGGGGLYIWDDDSVSIYSEYEWNIDVSLTAPKTDATVRYYRLAFKPFVRCMLDGVVLADCNLSFGSRMDAGSAFALGLTVNEPELDNLDMSGGMADADSYYNFNESSIIFTSERLDTDVRKLGFTFVMPDSGYVRHWLSNKLRQELEDSLAEAGGTLEQEYELPDLSAMQVTYHCDIVLETLSETTYAYCKSAEEYHDADWDLFTMEPVTIVSNVKGGLGLLSAASTSTLHVIW